MGERNNEIVKTTLRSLEIIEIVKQLNGASASEIREELGMAESTVYKHLNVLLEKGYLMEWGGQYELGFELFHLGEYVKKSVQYYHPIKEKSDWLRQNIPEQVEFGIECNGLVMGYIVSTDYNPSLFYELTEKNESEIIDYAGSKALMHTNAVGKALLGEKSNDEIRNIASKYGLLQQAKNTITSVDELLEEIDIIREQGFATTDEEWENGLREVGMTVKPNDHVIGGFNVFGPTYQISDDRLHEDLPELLRDVVSDLEEEILGRIE
ncbi:IclR family transcriptional regulator [Natrinema soli]|uniref:IclR family transcriptional regulator n=1 Tax=Natrinema soli TaxID=1930624 RepID=A0ABD5SMB4_9EURY|nr:IclR family transcriptional regulator C-terminal domain-containing protein [Natrinema soli]